MADQVRTLTIRQVLDAGSYVSGARDIASANRDMSAGARTLATDFNQVQVRLSSAADPLSRLTRAYDQAGAASNKFTSDLAALNRALETGGAERASQIYAGMVNRFGMMVDGAHLASQGFTRLGAVVEETNRAIMGQAAAARATALAARETDIYAQKAAALRAAIDPIGASQARLNAEIAEYTVLLNRAEITTTEFAQAQLMARQRHDELVASMNRTPANDNGVISSEAQYRRQNLGMQLFDVGQSMSLGMNPGMILAQQGPQIAQLYAMQGGLNAAMRDFGVILGTVARVAGPVIAVLAGLYGAYRLLQSYSAEAALSVDDATRALAAQASPISSLEGQIRELGEIQKKYNEALYATATAQDAASKAIVASSQREFNAKKALLEIELTRQEAALRVQESELAIAALQLKRQAASQLSTDSGRLVRDGYSDPRINGGIPFVRAPDDVTGLDKTAAVMEEIGKSPAADRVKELHANVTLTTIAVDKLREGVKQLFGVTGDVPKFDPVAYNAAILAKQQAYRDMYNPVPSFPNGVPIPEQRPIDGGDEPKNSGTLMQQQTGARSNVAEQVQARQQLLQTQNEEIEKLQLEAQLVGASSRERAMMTAALQAEQQLRQQGISLLSAEGQAYKNNAVMMAQARLEIERQNAAYSSLQTAGGSAIDSLTVGTGSLRDRLKAAADTMLQWIQQLTLANPLKNALFGTNLPTMADLFAGKPMMPGATSTATMTVTAGTVMVNGGMMPGAFPAAPGGTLGSLLGIPANQNIVNGVRPTLTPSGVVNSPVSLAAVNGVRPDLMTSGIVNSPVASPASTVANTGVQSQVWNYWAAKGLPPHQIAGIMGNIQAESAFRPGVDTGDGGNAWGLAQWNDRRNAMVNYVGQDWKTDVNGQMDFMNHEFQTTESASWNRLRASTDVKSATAAMAGYERPQGYSLTNPEGTHNWSGRLDAANANLAKFSSTTSSATKDVGSLSDSALKAGTSLTDSLGKVTSSVPAVPAVSPVATPTATSNPFASLFGGIFKLFSFADGIDFSPGGMAMVGERGPELVNLPRGSRVTPTHKLALPNSEERMRGRVERHEYSIMIAGLGDKELLARMDKAAEDAVLRGLRAADAALPDKIEAYRMNPYDRVS